MDEKVECRVAEAFGVTITNGPEWDNNRLIERVLHTCRAFFSKLVWETTGYHEISGRTWWLQIVKVSVHQVAKEKRIRIIVKDEASFSASVALATALRMELGFGVEVVKDW